jgi:surface carbohydrate biosynthesis protein (TIGR04326 family)
VTSLTIWADDDPPPANSGSVALWQAFLPDDAPDNWYSMPDEVHRNRESLRTDYLAWLHEAGVATVGGVPLVDRMAIRPGLSYWWMTIPADNSIESNSPAYIAVRLMALADLADRLGVTSMRIVTSDRSLARLLRDWAKSTGRAHETQLGPRPRLTRESIYRAFPFLAALRVVIGHAGIPRQVKSISEVSTVAAGQHGICLVDYMAHFAPGAVDEGRFASNYWGPLVEMLDNLDEPVRWLHISADLASSGVVTRDDELVGQFDANATRQTHDLLHRHLTWAVLTQSCRDYLRVRWFGISARPRARIFFDARSSTSFWQAFQNAYRDQFFGKTAMLNCLWLNLFEASLGRMPHQRLGIYLFENQPWEMAFIHVWCRAGHGELLGVAHSTTRFWDIRYFKDHRDLWSETGANPMPWPERVAVNGPLMQDACHVARYPDQRLVEVEALRYFGTEHAIPPRSSVGPLRILVCGDYSPVAAQRMLDLVNKSLEVTDLSMEISYRPHPTNARQNVHLHPDCRLDLASTIQEALDGSDLVVTGAMSSVSIEAVASGLTTVIVGDAHAFLTIPVDGASNLQFVTTVQGFLSSFRHLAERGALIAKVANDYFRLNSTLYSWRRVIAIEDAHK